MFNWNHFWMILIGFACIGTYMRLKEEKNFVGFYSRYVESKNYPSFSMCIPLKVSAKNYPLIGNCTHLEKQTNPYVRLICFVSKLDQLIPSKIIEYAKSLNVHEMFNITLTNHLLKNSLVYVNDFHLCISYQVYCLKNVSHSLEDDQNETDSENSKQFEIIKWTDVESLNSGTWTPDVLLSMIIVNRFKVTTKIFIYPSNEHGSYYFSLYKFNQFCTGKPLDRSECNSGQLIVSRINYTRLPSPYETDCFDYNKSGFNFTRNRIFSRISCLEECRKSIHTSNRSYYTENDGNVLDRKSNVKYNEAYCLFKCKRPDCSQNFYYVNSWKNLTTPIDKPLVKISFLQDQYDIVAYRKLSDLGFLLQMISYLCLVMNNNLIVQITKLHKEIVSKLVAFKFTKKLGKVLNTEFVHVRVHFIALILALIITFKAFSNILNEIDNKMDGYISYGHYPTNYTFIIVTVCFPIIDILQRPDKIAYRFGPFNQNSNQNELVKLNDNLLQAFTFNELNAITKNETELIKAEIVFSNIRSMNLNTKVLTSFQPTYRLLNQTAHIVNLTLYGKCFSYNISFIEFPFQRIFRMTSVKFSMIGEHFSHFTITENNRFPNYRDHKLFSVCHLHRLVEKIEQFQGNCMNYDEYETLKCTNRYECMDNCIKSKYARRFKKIPFTSIYREGEVIKDKDDAVIMKTETFTSQDNSAYNKIKEKCEKKFATHDCDRAQYMNLEACSNEDFDFSQILVNLYLTAIVELKQQKWSISELFNQATTLLSVLFGFSVPSVLRCLIQFVRVTFKMSLKSKKLRRFIRAFLFIAMIHNFNQITTRVSENNPVPNTLYSAYDTFKLPRVTTCFVYDTKEIDIKYNKLNKTITGYTLDEETKHMQIEKIYKTLKFYSADLQEVVLEFKDLVRNQNFKDYNVTFNRFYFQNYKCFNIHVNVTYETAHKGLFFIDDIMRLYLEHDAPVGKLFFSLSPENTMNFNELNKIYHNCLHLVSFETFRVTNVDYFKFIRNPSLMFKKAYSVYDEEKYLHSLADELAKYNLTSVLLPIYEKDFHLKIDYNKSLEIYINHILPLEKLYSHDPNYERLIFKSIKMYKQVNNFTLLLINPSFLYFRINYTNREHPSVIIMYLLNAVSCWMDINYVDYPKVIGRLFRGIFRMIRSLKYKL